MKKQLINEERILTKAIMNLAQQCGFSNKDLSLIIGVSEATITRLYNGKHLVDPHNKEGELVLLLLRLYRSLSLLVGGSEEKIRLWLNNYNYYFNNTPQQHIRTIIGLVEVVNYLDAMRGKL